MLQHLNLFAEIPPALFERRHGGIAVHEPRFGVHVQPLPDAALAIIVVAFVPFPQEPELLLEAILPGGVTFFRPLFLRPSAFASSSISRSVFASLRTDN